MTKRTRIRRLSIKRETVRRLTGEQLGQVAGGKNGVRCTYELSGCAVPETGNCPTFHCGTLQCPTGTGPDTC